MPKAGVTRYLSRRGSTPRPSQPGGPGKRTGRSMTRTMQPRKGPPSGIAGRDGAVGGDSLVIRGSLVSLGPARTGGASGPTGVGSAARADSTPGKVGKVSRVASALPHSEGGAYKRGRLVKWPRACETGGWGRSKPRWAETAELGPEPRTPGVSGASRDDDPSGLPFGASYRSTVDHVGGGCAKVGANQVLIGACGEHA